MEKLANVIFRSDSTTSFKKGKIMRSFLLLVSGVFLFIGCAHVKLEAPQEPIKLDVSMRLDIYQHIESDINQIENKVDASSKPRVSDKQSLLDYFVTDAYAQELSPEVESAVTRRQARHMALFSWEQKGIVGENASGLVEIRGSQNEMIQGLVSNENNDRMIIYRALADENGTSVKAIQNLYAK